EGSGTGAAPRPPEGGAHRLAPAGPGVQPGRPGTLHVQPLGGRVLGLDQLRIRLAGSLTDRRTRRLTMAVGPVDDSSGEPTAGHGDACGVPVTLGETFGVGPHVGELVRRNPHVLTREPGDG